VPPKPALTDNDRRQIALEVLCDEMKGLEEGHVTVGIADWQGLEDAYLKPIAPQVAARTNTSADTAFAILRSAVLQQFAKRGLASEEDRGAATAPGLMEIACHPM
jgi:hypothetical protein